MSAPATAKEELPAPLNNYWRLMWMFWMQPILLQQQIKMLGVEVDANILKAWRKGGGQWCYMVRLAQIVGGWMLFGLFLLGFVNVMGLSVKWGGVALVVVFVAISVLTSGVTSTFALGAASGIVVSVLPNSLSLLLSGIVGAAIGAVLSVIGGVVNGSDSSKSKSATLGAVLGVTSGAAYLPPLNQSAGAVFGMACVLMFVRFPIYLFELTLQIFFANPQNLRKSSIFWHDLSYLPLPYLGRQMVLCAETEPSLTREAIQACFRTPGQKNHARWALAQLEAKEFNQLASRNQFAQAMELQGVWLPSAEAAGPGTLLLRDVAKHIQAAHHASTAHHRLRYLQDAQALLNRFPQTLASETRVRAEALRPVQAVWQNKLDERLRQAWAEAANHLPNPFLSQPLNPEAGPELFLGREPLIRQLEALLADPAQRNSIAVLGPRRCGKSSLLRMLPLKLPDAVPVFFDLQDNPASTPAQFYSAIARRVAEQARRERGLTQLPTLPNNPDTPTFATWLEQLDDALGERRLLLCIDEFERLPDLFPDAAGQRRDLLQFMGLLRATVQHRRNIRVLVAGVAPFDELDSTLWSDHFINLRELRVEHLDEASAVQLLSAPIPELRAISPELARQVFERTGGQPLLLQLYGLMLVDKLNAERRTQATADDLAEVDTQLREGGNAVNHFRNLYSAAPPDAQTALLALAHGEPVTLRPATQRYLLRRCLITREGQPRIPVFFDWVRAEC